MQPEAQTWKEGIQSDAAARFTVFIRSSDLEYTNGVFRFGTLIKNIKGISLVQFKYESRYANIDAIWGNNYIHWEYCAGNGNGMIPYDSDEAGNYTFGEADMNCWLPPMGLDVYHRVKQILGSGEHNTVWSALGQIAPDTLLEFAYKGIELESGIYSVPPPGNGADYQGAMVGRNICAYIRDIVNYNSWMTVWFDNTYHQSDLPGDLPINLDYQMLHMLDVFVQSDYHLKFMFRSIGKVDWDDGHHHEVTSYVSFIRFISLPWKFIGFDTFGEHATAFKPRQRIYIPDDWPFFWYHQSLWEVHHGAAPSPWDGYTHPWWNYQPYDHMSPEYIFAALHHIGFIRAYHQDISSTWQVGPTAPIPVAPFLAPDTVYGPIIMTNTFRDHDDYTYYQTEVVADNVPNMFPFHSLMVVSNNLPADTMTSFYHPNQFLPILFYHEIYNSPYTVEQVQEDAPVVHQFPNYYDLQEIQFTVITDQGLVIKDLPWSAILRIY